MSMLDPLKPYWAAIKLVLFIGLIVAALIYQHRVKAKAFADGEASGKELVRQSELKAANDRAKAWEDSSKRYQARAEAQEVVSGQYLEELNKGNDRADKLAADVRSGDLRFNRLWSQCQAVSTSGQTPSGPGSADAGADDRAASAGRIVRAAAACDAQVRALQSILTTERQVNG